MPPSSSAAIIPNPKVVPGQRCLPSILRPCFKSMIGVPAIKTFCLNVDRLNTEIL